MIEKTVIDSYNKIKRLPVEELEKLWYAFFEDKTNKKLRDQLIVQYIYLTKYVIGRIKGNLPPSFSIDDIAGYGVEGLIDAIEKYSPDKGARFETYAIMRIRGTIIDKIRAQALSFQLQINKSFLCPPAAACSGRAADRPGGTG